MKKLPSVMVGVLLYSSGSALAAEAGKSENGWSLFTRLDSFSYSDSAPIDQVVHNFEGDPIDSGEVAFTHNIVEIGGSYNNFELSVFQRYDYHLDFSSDTALLVYQDKNDLPVSANRTYNLDLDANHIRARGLKLGYRWDLSPQLYIKLAASYLQADALLDGDLKGLITTSDTSYSGELQLDYNYSEDQLFDQIVEEPDGKGYALDVYAHWQVSEQFTLDVALEDLTSRITWDDAPFTRAQVTSNTVSYDSDGFLDVSPALTFTQAYRDDHQRLPMRALVSGIFSNSTHYATVVRWRRVGETDFPSLGVRYLLSSKGYWQINYDFEAKSVGLGYRYGAFQFSLAADKTDWEEARALGLSLQYRLRF